MSQSAQRTLRVLKALKGHYYRGVSNNELAEQLGESPVSISRSLDDLVSEGLARRLENGCYSHSMSMLQIAQAYANEASRLQAEMQETNQRIMAGAQL